MSQYRIVERTLQAALEMAVQPGQGKHPLAVVVGDIDMPGQRDARLGQRAGLVRAQHVHRAQIVDRWQALYDHALMRQPDRATREGDGHDHRQEFRRQPDRERQRKDHGVHPGPVERHALGHHQQDEHHGDTQDQYAEPAQPNFEGGRRRLGD